MKASGAPRLAQHRGELALEGRQPGRRSGRADPLLGRRPPLVAVLAEDEELGATVEHRVAQGVEVTHRDRLAGRSTRDHRDRTHHLGQLQQRAGRTGVQAGGFGVVDHRGQRAVEVEAHDRAAEDVAYGVVVGACVVGGELHGISQSRAGATRGTGPDQRPGPAVTAGRRW
jgi:hypothetical protein